MESYIEDILLDLEARPEDPGISLRLASELYKIADCRQLLQVILDAVLTLTRMEFGFIALKKGGASYSVPVISKRPGLSSGIAGNDLIHWALHQSESKVFAQESFPDELAEPASTLGLRRILCLPFVCGLHRSNHSRRKPRSWGVLYTHSTNPVVDKQLPDAALNIFAGHAAMAMEREHLQYIATIDSLTGLYRRNYLWNRMEMEWSRALRHDRPVSVAMIDIDHFKQINDTYGHACGDQLLQQTALTLKKTIRKEDLLGRYGGDEFLLLLPETERSGASIIAERLREAVQLQGPGTISVGLCSYPEVQIRTIRHLVEKADLALLKAKSEGKNRVNCLSLNVV